MATMQRCSRQILPVLLALILAACGKSAATSSTGGSTNVITPASTVSIPVAQASAVAPTDVPIPSSVATTAATPEPSATPEVATSAAASSAPVPASGSAIDAITVAYQAAATAKSYRVHSTITGAKTSIVNTYEIVKPDRLHGTAVVNGRTREQISIGTTTYARTNGGAWTKSTDTSGDGGLMKQFTADAASIADLTKKITEAKEIGPDTLDGKPMTVYQYKFAAKVNDAGAQSSSITKLWLGADKRPYKLESDGSSNISGTTTTSHIVNLYSDYDSDIKIEAPIP